MPRAKVKRKSCIECSKEIHKNADRFCSGTCQQTCFYKEYIKRWLEGKELGYGKDQSLSHYIKRWLRETKDNKCEKCGWKEIHPITGIVPLQANHKDGDYSNCSAKNLELICPSCHSLTPNFGALNKGKGRDRRRAVVAQSVVQSLGKG